MATAVLRGRTETTTMETTIGNFIVRTHVVTTMTVSPMNAPINRAGDEDCDDRDWDGKNSPRTPKDADDDGDEVGDEAAYRQVAKTVRSTPTQVKEVAEAMVALAAKQLKAAGRFTIPGAFYMKLKKTPATPARIGVNKVT